MANCNCEFELNKQLQGLAARVSQAENNITNHFYGISMLVNSMLANPLTAGPAAVVESIYNFIPNGFDLLQKLIENISPIDFKKLMMITAGDLLGLMEAELDALLSQAVSMVEAQIAALEQSIVDAIDSVTNLEAALEAAIIGGIQEEIDAATAALSDAQNLVSSLNSQKASKLDLKLNVTDFLAAQADIARCKAMALQLRK